MLLARSLPCLLVVALAGCGDNVECGPGTTRKVDPQTNKAECVAPAATSVPCDVDGGARLVGGVCEGDPAQFPSCGPGTKLDPKSGKCVALGGSGLNPPPCPNPDQSHICVNGVVRLLKDGSSTKGKTLEVRAYDPLGFLFNDAAMPLAKTTTDAMGTYVLPDIPWGMNMNLIAVAVTDVGGPMQYVLAGSGGQNLAGGNAYQIDLFAVEAATVAGWDMQLGFSGADTFEQHGAYVALFLDSAAPDARPVADVVLTANMMPASDTFYFKGDRATLDKSAKGTDAATGSALQRVVPKVLGNYSGKYTGMGTAPGTFPTILGGAKAGVVFIVPFQAM